jgi:hypothetical protein
MLLHPTTFLPRIATGMLLVLLASPAAGGSPAHQETPRPIPLRDDEGAYYTFSPDGRTVAVVASAHPGAGLVRLRDRASGAMLAEAAAEFARWRSRYLTLSPDGRRLALVSWTTRTDEPPYVIKCWEVNAERKLIRPHQLRHDYSLSGGQYLFHCSFSPDGNTLAAGTGQEVIYLWDTNTGAVRRRFQGGVAAGFSADGRTLIAVTHDGLVRRFAFPACKLLGPDESAPRTDFLYINQVAFSPDGRSVALSDDRTTVVKDVSTGWVVGRLTVAAHTQSLSFSPGGKLLAVSAGDGTHLLDLSTGRERAWLQRPAVFFPVGDFLVCHGDKGLTFRETAAVLSRAEKAPAPPKTDPPGVPLEARLVSRQATYLLDLEGDRPEETSNRIKFGDWPDLPELGLVLELRNAGKKPLNLRDDTGFSPTLYLVGPGAVNYPLWIRQTFVGFLKTKRRTLAPGATCRVPVTDLADNVAPFWLLAGDYTLVGDCRVEVAPAPEGSTSSGDGFGYVHLGVAPISLKVVAGKRPSPPWLAEPPPPAPRLPPPGTVRVPAPKDDSEELQKKLYMPIDLDKGIDPGTPLKEALEFLGDRYDLTFRIDRPAFKKRGVDDPETRKTEIPPIKGIGLRAVLQILLDPLDADVDVRHNALWIVPLPKPQSLADRLPRAPRRMRREMGQQFSIEPGIPAGTPLAQALALLGERYDRSFYIDVRAFRQAGIADIERRPVKLAPRKSQVPLGMMVKEVLDQAGAAFVLRDHLVLVIPAARK